jgi:DNA-directed RNA polymerase
MMETHKAIETKLPFKSGPLNVRVRELRPDIEGSSLAFIPNMIHSLDAAVIHKMIIGTPLDGDRPLVVGTIHDSIGARACDLLPILRRFVAAFGDIHMTPVENRIGVNTKDKAQLAALDAIKA